MTPQAETILILDSGSRHTQLAARRCRECGVYSKIVPPSISAEDIEKIAPKGMIFFGDPVAVDPAALGVPTLEIDSHVDKARMEHFVRNTCGCRDEWSMKSYARTAIEKFRGIIGDGQVICALSGGVDSAVVAAILAKAVGRQTKCILVDTGLMRKNEIANVMAAFGDHLDVEFKMIDASDGFLERLAGVEEPQDAKLSDIISSTFSPRPPRNSEMPGSWPRERFIPTSSKAGPRWTSSGAAGPKNRRRRSNCTTMSAGCRRNWASLWSNRYGNCSRAKCGNSVWNWACRRI